tara:strand:+ start:265 stop:1329 length:1065 start_codon:yes stop_codon:yes gene_type:complete
MSDALNTLRLLADAQGGYEDKRGDPRDAVGKAAIARSEDWLKKNKHLTRDALYDRWKTEIRTGFIVTPNNKDYVWETEANLHPLGPSFATEDYLARVRETLTTLDDAGKQAYLQDIAREAPSPVLNNLVLEYGTLHQKSSEKVRERSRLANIHEFQNMAENFIARTESGELPSLSHEASVPAHAEDLMWAYIEGKTDIFVDGEGRIAITGDNGPEPVWAMQKENTVKTWEEVAVNVHDLTALSKRMIKPLVERSREHAKSIENIAVLELLNSVETQPREFQASIIVDGAAASENPGTVMREAIHRSVEQNINYMMYRNMKDLTRDYFTRWSELNTTISGRANDGFINLSQGGSK